MEILLLFRPHFIINIIYIPDNQLCCPFLQTLYFRPYLVLLLKNILYFCALNVIILNMRRSISFTILFFMMLSVLVSCYQSHKRELDLAYTLAESKPDSALAFLNRIIKLNSLMKIWRSMPSLITWHKTSRAWMWITIP